MNNQLTVLVVDDDSDIRTVAGLALSRVGGYRVLEAPTVAEALAVLGTHAVDVVLLDVAMPGESGTALLGEMRKDDVLSVIPVIFFTAGVMPSELVQLSGLGAAGFIAKPFDPMKLSDLLAEKLEAVGRVHHRDDSESHPGVYGEIERLWVVHRDSLIGDLATVERQLEMMVDGAPPSDLSAAHGAAHRLTGALGVYGRYFESGLARQLEESLERSVYDPEERTRARHTVNQLRNRLASPNT